MNANKVKTTGNIHEQEGQIKLINLQKPTQLSDFYKTANFQLLKTNLKVE